MRYVLDASVALKWVLTEPDSAKAQSLRDDFRRHLHELLVPDVFSLEVAHALTRAERRGFLKAPQAIRLLADVLSTPMPTHANRPLLARAVVLSSTMRCGVYDCLYVALAEREGCEFLTADDKLVTNLGPQYPYVISLASMP
ncbi:MAG: type II toxin-antitoxin system VapC family toxin [Planctomycetes bacterium]|nr:type II toxin-antitoxin system VapC family toxin [Planctomycetota bacterium]